MPFAYSVGRAPFRSLVALRGRSRAHSAPGDGTARRHRARVDRGRGRHRHRRRHGVGVHCARARGRRAVRPHRRHGCVRRGDMPWRRRNRERAMRERRGERGEGNNSWNSGWAASLPRAFGDEADVVVSNPPYISWNEAADLPALVRDWEPAVALFAADDGMACIRAIASEAASVLQGRRVARTRGGLAPRRASDGLGRGDRRVSRRGGKT